MLEYNSTGYGLEEGVILTAEQQERFEQIKTLAPGFMPDYEAYILDGSMPSEVDDQGGKRDLSKHPMRDLVIEHKISKVVEENARLRGLLVDKAVITSKEADGLKVVEPVKEEPVIKK